MRTIYLRSRERITITVGKRPKELKPILGIEAFAEHWQEGYCLLTGRYYDEELCELPGSGFVYKLSHEEIDTIAAAKSIAPETAETERRRILMLATAQAMLNTTEDYGLNGNDYEEYDPPTAIPT